MFFLRRTRAKRVMAVVCACIMAMTLIVPYIGSLSDVFADTKSGTTKSVDGDYFYDFRDGSIIPTNTDGKSDVEYETLKVKVGTQNAYQYNGAEHGVAFKAGNSIEIAVSGAARIIVGDCQFSNMTEMTIKSADGTYSETQSLKAGCYHNDGSTAVFNYTGEAAATLIIEFTNTTYVPCIEVVALHKEYDFRDGSVIPTNTDGKSDVEFGSLTVKVGTQNAYNYNGAEHGVAFKAGNSVELKVSGPTKVTVGDCQFSNMTEMTIKSADGTYSETQSLKAGCYHNDGSAAQFKYTSDAAATLIIEFTNTTYVPIIMLDAIMEDIPDDNGVSKDTVYMYNFADGSVLPASYDSANPLPASFTSSDGMLTINSNNDLYMHDTQHGLAMYNGNSFEIKVAGDSIVTFNLCQYGADNTAVIAASSKKGEFVTEKSQPLMKAADDGLSAVSFEYKGVATTLKFTVKAADKAEMYLHGINVSNKPAATDVPQLAGNGKTDVWDFGAEQLDTAKYNNKLTVDTINGFYGEGVAVGSEGATIGSFGTDELFFNPAGKTNNRIRTSNTSITRYDTRDNITVDGTTLTGYIYSNNTTPVVYLGIKLYENDILTLYTGSNGGASNIVCESPSGKIQTGASSVEGVKLTFYAAEYGMYKIYSTNEKLVVYRAERAHTQPVKVSGSVDVTAAAGIESKDYKLMFTNESTGEETIAEITGGSYSVYLNEQYTYGLSLVNANGYVIKSARTLEIPQGKGDVTENVVIEAVDLVTVTGELTGLTADALTKLKLSFNNDEYIYIPEISITGNQFTAQLERGVNYKIVAEDINDYYLSDITTISKSADSTQNITFTLKPLYDVAITLKDIPDEAKSTAIITFSNINEEGYVYSFSIADSIKLRDGQYKVNVTGVSTVPYIQKLTSDLKVSGAAASKEIAFEKLEVWDFAAYNGNPGLETINGVPYYLGLELTAGNVMENKTYLLVNEGGEVKLPVKKGQLVTLEYCYCADFEVAGVQVSSNSGSTSTFETTQVTAADDGFMTIKGIAADKKQTYFTKITISDPVAYKDKVYVGKDKEYKTINAALADIAKMDRSNNERVQIVVDPGNYEEMLVIDLPNISIVNAAGDKASIELTNKGVDIAENVVRITSYYGHGYNYYSMDSGCKYDEDLLAANKENGYLTKVNPGSGSTDGSYWNATVVVKADGFEADGIVFENSFNQYISKKEANDIVVMWDTGSKGERPTTEGDTSVQSKKFVERAAAMAVLGDKAVFTGCKFIGRQDTLYGAANIKTVFEKCDVLGGTDYIFGGMTAVFYQCNLVMNTDDATSTDVSYITAAQQTTGRGYLMYNCTVTSTTPGVDTASKTKSRPGYFGRPWAANTSEVVFFVTNIESTDHVDAAGKSLIAEVGWNNTLSGESKKMYEYGSKELSGENNSASRAAWATLLDTPYIDDGATKITVEAFLGDWTAELNARGLVLELNADYSEVDEALAHIASLNKDDYENFEILDAPMAAVEKDLWIAYQSKVDDMAKALNSAIESLVKKTTEPAPGPSTGDSSNPTMYIIMMIAAVLLMAGAVAMKKYRKI